MTDKQYETERLMRFICMSTDYEEFDKIYEYLTFAFPQRKHETVVSYNCENKQMYHLFYNLTSMEYSEVIARITNIE